MNKIILIIRDGWGYSEKTFGNAILKANTPNDDLYAKTYPHCILKCTGNDVGNPEGVQGGSEVGHLTIGAGRIVWQPYELINQEIKNGGFFKNKALLDAIENCKKNNTDLHLAGLFSDQGIHADFRHMFAILNLCKREKFDRVYIHIVADGRDVPEKSVLGFIQEAKKAIAEIGIGKIASIAGRYYTMDRDNNRERTKKGYDVMVKGIGYTAKNIEQAVEDAYARGDKTDYYIQPTILVDENEKPIGVVKSGDSFIRYNFRTDRSLQITAMMNGLDICPEEYRGDIKVHYVCFSEYADNWTLPVAFPQTEVTNNLGETIAKNGGKQLRIAETEKFAHVTFFFNSQKNDINEGEERIMIPSPKVASYDLQPEMSAYQVTDKLLEQIGKYDFIAVNYANPDLVGHSGIFDAVVKACEVVDECVGKVVNKGLKEGYTIFLMADHGNADNMIYENGEKDASHGFNPVRLTVISNQKYILKDGGMKDVAPTILHIMGIPIPKEMTGNVLI